MRALTTAQMQRIDKIAVSEYRTPVLLLMENAGRSVALFATDFARRKRIIVLCGGGNNGGDGVVAARCLHNWGFRVQVWWLKNPQKWEGDVARHYQMAKRAGVRFESFERIPLARRLTRLRQADVIVDALLGTGTRGEIRGLFRDAIETINAARRPVVSVDIPSGLDSDTGKPLGAAVKARVTVTMAAAKKGLLKSSARPYVGRLVVADIGIPLKLLNSR